MYKIILYIVNLFDLNGVGWIVCCCYQWKLTEIRKVSLLVDKGIESKENCLDSDFTSHWLCDHRKDPEFLCTSMSSAIE